MGRAEMTQENRNTFLTSVPVPMLKAMQEDKGISRDLKPSPELLSLIKAAVSSLVAFGELWESIKHKGIDEGFQEQDLQDMLRPLLRDRLGMSKDKIYYLFHKEEQKERVKTHQDHRKKTKFLEKKEPEQSYNPDEEIKKIGEIRRAEQKKEAEEPIIPDDEDPKDLEIQFLKERVAELEDALKKTEQFKPATELQAEVPTSKQLTLDEIFESLPDDQAMTCWKINRIAGNALKNRISAWQGNSNKFFRVWLQEV